jgi:hypothetical protein
MLNLHENQKTRIGRDEIGARGAGQRMERTQAIEAFPVAGAEDFAGK